MAGVEWPTTVTRKMGAGPSCAFWLAGVWAVALPATRPAAINSIDEMRMDMTAGSATSGPARKGTFRHPIAGAAVSIVLLDHIFCARLFRSRRSVPLGADEVDEGDREGGKRKRTEACPAAAIEAERTEVRAERSAGEERHHVERVEPGSRGW